MAATLKASVNGLKEIKRKREESGWSIEHDIWLKKAGEIVKKKHKSWTYKGEYLEGCSLSTWKRFLGGKAINAIVFKAFCKVLDVEWKDVVEQGENQLEKALSQEPFAEVQLPQELLEVPPFSEDQKLQLPPKEDWIFLGLVEDTSGNMPDEGTQLVSGRWVVCIRPDVVPSIGTQVRLVAERSLREKPPQPPQYDLVEPPRGWLYPGQKLVICDLYAFVHSNSSEPRTRVWAKVEFD